MNIDAISGQQLVSVADFKVQANTAPALQPATVANDKKTTTEQGTAPEKLSQAVATMNQMAQKLTTNLSFSVDNSTGMTVVKVMEADTNTVIRQIPSNEILAIAHALDTFQGLIIRNRA